MEPSTVAWPNLGTSCGYWWVQERRDKSRDIVFVAVLSIFQPCPQLKWTSIKFFILTTRTSYLWSSLWPLKLGAIIQNSDFTIQPHMTPEKHWIQTQAKASHSSFSIKAMLRTFSKGSFQGHLSSSKKQPACGRSIIAPPGPLSASSPADSPKKAGLPIHRAAFSHVHPEPKVVQWRASSSFWELPIGRPTRRSKTQPKTSSLQTFSLLKPSGRSKHVEKSWFVTSGSTALVIAKCWNVETAKRGVLERLPFAKSTA